MLKFRYEYANCPCCNGQLSYENEEDGAVAFRCYNEECPIISVSIYGKVN